MNILYTITRCWPAIGGAETYVRQVARTLSARHRTAVIAHTSQQQVDPIRVCTTGATRMDSYEDGDTRIHLLGATRAERLRLIPAARLYPYPATKPMGYRFYASVFAPKLSAFLRAHRIDVVHNVLVGTEYLSHVSCQVAHRHGIPFVITPLVHEGIWGDGPFFFGVYRQADAVIALLNVERDLYIRNGVPASRIHTIGVSPVIAESCDAAFFRKKHRLSGRMVLFVGRQIESKGYPVLLAAAPMVWQRHPETSFVFIGPMENASRAMPHAADPRIVPLGPVSDAEKTSAMAACDLFCLPSNSEIMPTAILEAWSFGKPVIGGAIPTLQELIQASGGGVVVPQQPEALARAILAFLDDAALARRCGEAGRQQVMERYTSERVAGALERVYASLRGNGSA
jgi:glycosyltransferase involved in cell wall biosynthesis